MAASAPGPGVSEVQHAIPPEGTQANDIKLLVQNVNRQNSLAKSSKTCVAFVTKNMMTADSENTSKGHEQLPPVPTRQMHMMHEAGELPAAI